MAPLAASDFASVAALAPTSAEPAPLYVQNTFLTCAEARPASLEEFYELRRIRSWHASCGSELSSGEEEAPAAPAETRTRPYYPGRQLVRGARAALGREASAGGSSGSSTAAPPSPASGAEPRPEALELPSVGSAGHRQGTCKPCVFVAKRGCKSGRACGFCHLCEPGEKKRRQKEKRALFGALRRLGAPAAGGRAGR